MSICILSNAVYGSTCSQETGVTPHFPAEAHMVGLEAASNFDCQILIVGTRHFPLPTCHICCLSCHADNKMVLHQPALLSSKCIASTLLRCSTSGFSILAPHRLHPQGLTPPPSESKPPPPLYDSTCTALYCCSITFFAHTHHSLTCNAGQCLWAMSHTTSAMQNWQIISVMWARC